MCGGSLIREAGEKEMILATGAGLEVSLKSDGAGEPGVCQSGIVAGESQLGQLIASVFLLGRVGVIGDRGKERSGLIVMADGELAGARVEAGGGGVAAGGGDVGESPDGGGAVMLLVGEHGGVKGGVVVVSAKVGELESGQSQIGQGCG